MLKTARKIFLASISFLLIAYPCLGNDVQSLKSRAQKGDPQAQLILSEAYRTGDGVEKDRARSVQWLKKAAGQGLAEAQTLLGLSYYLGQGAARDDHKAVEWFQKAAEQNNADAQYYLGGMLRLGDGIQQNHAEAVKWLLRAADQGHEGAQFSLGMMYEMGEGVARDRAKAEKWFAKVSAPLGLKAETSRRLMFSQKKGGSEKADYVDSLTGMEFVLVKGGEFKMGRDAGASAKRGQPARQVKFSDFYIGKYEVTQYQWEKVMGFNLSQYKGVDKPIHSAAYFLVLQFIKRLNQKTGRNYRLLTEAEWEYAARGAKTETVINELSPEEIAQYAWHEDNSADQIHPVGSKKPNQLGLYDMLGNVSEWVGEEAGDRDDEKYPAESEVDNTQGAEAESLKTVRGGSYAEPVWPVAERGGFPPDVGPGWVGFRLACSVEN